MKFALLFNSLILFVIFADAQLLQPKETFTKADTLRGSITQYRKGWDVLKYDLTVQPDPVTKTLSGKNTITYKEDLPVVTMQIDLQQPLVADSVVGEGGNRYTFKRDGNVCFVNLRDSFAK